MWTADLVQGASQATLNALLVKLGRLLAHEYALVRGVRGDIQYINDEMASMQAFLGGLSAVPHGHDRRVKDWMKQIRDVSYDVEDCVDDFEHRLSHNPGGDVICLGTLVAWVYEAVTWWPRRDIASTVAELKARAQQIGERRIRYGVENPKSNGEASSGGAGFDAAENQQTSLQLVGARMPVGVEVMHELSKWVRIISAEGEEDEPVQLQPLQKPSSQTHPAQSQRRNSDKKIFIGPAEPVQVQDPCGALPPATQSREPCSKVLCLVGFGGVGKTTIATALYQKFGDQFDCRARVTVSQSSNIEEILRSILRQVIMPQSEDGQGQQGASEKRSFMVRSSTIFKNALDQLIEDDSHHIQNMEQGELSTALKEHLGTHSCLLLIDDVWSKGTWNKIKTALPESPSKKHCRVIVMTRFQAVATASKGGERDHHVHKVVVLNDCNAKKLFMEAMDESEARKEDKGNQKRVPVPARLWEMCGGLPLAIVTMAGHVACNPHRPEREWSKVCDTLVPDSAKHLAQDGVMRIIAHCYNDMNAEIKTCALYLSIFPEGRMISRKRLIRRWIAEGLVREKQGLSVEDVAEAYFNHLIMRNIIRPMEHSSNGKVKSYQVHNMVLEYIVLKASEENFVTVVGDRWLMVPSSSKVRRLSLQQCGNPRHGKAVDNMNLSHVRSLTVLDSMDKLHLRSNSFKFGIVQVLDLEGCNDFRHHHAKEIWQMRLLKYLGLRGTGIRKLSKKIKNLQYLETLDVRETNVTELPKTMCRLERVVNILGGNKRKRKGLKLPEDLKNTMKALRVLSGIEIVQGGRRANPVADFHHLTDLRKLAIYKLKIYSWDLAQDLCSSIEYLGGYSLHTLVIEDDSSGLFIESLDELSSPPRFLTCLELSGMLVELPGWITELEALTKLTLSVTALSSDALWKISQLKTLFSLTFSLAPEKQDPEAATIIDDNKAESDGEILFPAGGFENLKLLRFAAPFVPLLRFSPGAMPKLERLELRFSTLEGLYDIENLGPSTEVHIRMHDKADEVTKLMVQNMATTVREDDGGPRIIVHQYQY